MSSRGNFSPKQYANGFLTVYESGILAFLEFLQGLFTDSDECGTDTSETSTLGTSVDSAVKAVLSESIPQVEALIKTGMIKGLLPLFGPDSVVVPQTNLGMVSNFLLYPASDNLPYQATSSIPVKPFGRLSLVGMLNGNRGVTLQWTIAIPSEYPNVSFLGNAIELDSSALQLNFGNSFVGDSLYSVLVVDRTDKLPSDIHMKIHEWCDRHNIFWNIFGNKLS